MILIALMIIGWLLLGFLFTIGLIHHSKTIFGREVYSYLKEVGQENLFNSQKYSMSSSDILLGIYLSFLGPVMFVLLLIKLFADVIVLALSYMSNRWHKP